MIILTPTDINNTKSNMHFYKPNKRLESWEICHNEFLEARNSQAVDKRLLTLHLMGFLSSWGMYCRKAPLFLNHHYLVHEDLIDTLLDKRYDKLFEIKDNNDFCTNIGLMDEVYEKIATYYQARGNKKGNMSSSAKQRTFSEKKGTIFFVPESVIHRN